MRTVAACCEPRGNQPRIITTELRLVRDLCGNSLSDAENVYIGAVRFEQ
jgi:hypothetical protein